MQVVGTFTAEVVDSDVMGADDNLATVQVLLVGMGREELRTLTPWVFSEEKEESRNAT